MPGYRWQTTRMRSPDREDREAAAWAVAGVKVRIQARSRSKFS